MSESGDVSHPRTFEDLKKRYQQFLSKRDANRSMWVFWETSPTTYHDPKGLIELSTGMPNELFFQIDSINLNLLKSPQDRTQRVSPLMRRQKLKYMRWPVGLTF